MSKKKGFDGEHEMERIEWEDHTSLGGWRTQEELKKPVVLGCVSVGWVVREDEKVVVLAGTYDTKEADGGGIDNNDVNHCHVLLKSIITKRERLRVVDSAGRRTPEASGRVAGEHRRKE
jgi:hypothetical protein